MVDEINNAIELASVELAPIASIFRRLDEVTLSRSFEHYFGDRLFFYSRFGNYLGKSDLISSVSAKIATAGEVGLAVIEEPNHLREEGGIICLKGFSVYNFTRVLAYGDVDPSVVLFPPLGRVLATAAGDFPCTDLGIDELISNSTTETPGPGGSYQRTGFGVAPVDFSWTVAPATLGKLNVGQDLPRCISECDREGHYRIHKKGIFGRCHEKCNREFFVKIRTRFFGWKCGACD